jgi:hypothetical protein
VDNLKERSATLYKVDLFPYHGILFLRDASSLFIFSTMLLSIPCDFDTIYILYYVVVNPGLCDLMLISVCSLCFLATPVVKQWFGAYDLKKFVKRDRCVQVRLMAILQY